MNANASRKLRQRLMTATLGISLALPGALYAQETDISDGPLAQPATSVKPNMLLILDDSGSREERMASFANVRAHGPLGGVPVVLLAYDADIESFSAAITRGAAAYLVKPVAAEEIVAVAHKISGWLRSSDRTEKRRRQRRPPCRSA